MENPPIFNGKIHYKWAMFNSYVKLPEGFFFFRTEPFFSFKAIADKTSSSRFRGFASTQWTKPLASELQELGGSLKPWKWTNPRRKLDNNHHKKKALSAQQTNGFFPYIYNIC